MARGGRLGPRRTTSSRRHRTRTASPVASASSRASAGTGLCRLPPNAPPLANGEAGRWPGRAQLASGSTYAGSTHDVCKVRAHSPSGSATGCDRGTVLLRPWTRPSRGPRGTQVGSKRRHRPPAGPAPSTARSRRRIRRHREPRRARRSERPAPRPGPATRPARGCAGLPTPGAALRRPPGHCTQPPRSTASRCTGTGGHAAPPRPPGAVGGLPVPGSSRAASRRTMPGVQNPHWLAPCWTNAAAQRSRSASGAPSSVVT